MDALTAALWATMVVLVVIGVISAIVGFERGSRAASIFGVAILGLAVATAFTAIWLPVFT